jgi:hypothetical protein
MIFALLLASCASIADGNQPFLDSTDPRPTQVEKMELEDYGPAPELTNETWLNTEEPLRLADLRGKVVLIDFWTFG